MCVGVYVIYPCQWVPKTTLELDDSLKGPTGLRKSWYPRGYGL